MSATKDLVQFSYKQVNKLRRSAEAVCAAGSHVDAEAVHDLRVACRRLTEPLRVLARVASKKRSRKLRGRLKSLRKACNDARDCEVLEQSTRVDEDATALPAGRRDQLLAVLAERRTREVGRLPSVLHRHGPNQLCQVIVGFLESVADADADTADEALRRAAERQWQKRVERLLRLGKNEEDETSLHDVRVAVKALRYSSELRQRIENRPQEELLSAFETMQDRLGAWHDHVAAAQALGRLATKPRYVHARPGWSAAVLGYAQRRIEKAEQMRPEIEKEVDGLIERIRRLVESPRPDDDETTSATLRRSA